MKHFIKGNLILTNNKNIIFHLLYQQLINEYSFDLFLVSVWLTLMVFNSLINAIPVPEIRTDIESDPKGDKGAPPKEVQRVNIWLGEKKKSDVLKDILEVATMIKNMKKNKKKISSNYIPTYFEKKTINGQNYL